DGGSIARASKWLRDHGGEERIVYKVNTMLGLAEVAAGGVGLALLPCFIGETVPGLVRLCEPIAELQGELWLLTHPDLRNTARVLSSISVQPKWPTGAPCSSAAPADQARRRVAIPRPRARSSARSC